MKFEDFVIYRIIRDFLFFRNDELSDLFFEWKFESDLLFKRILLKQEYLKLILKKNVNIISIGQNCLPHTVSIWNGLKLPNYLNKQPRGFFDLSVTNLKAASILLNNKNYEQAIIVDKLCRIGSDYFFGSDKLSLLFNHDPCASTNALEKAFDDFNATLKTRLDNFYYQSTKDRNLFIINIEKPEKIEDIEFIYSFIRAANTENKLLIVNQTNVKYEDALKFNDLHIINVIKPPKYIWYKDVDNSTEAGWNFENTLCQKISEIVSDYPDENGVDTEESILSKSHNSKFYLRLQLYIAVCRSNFIIFNKIIEKDPDFNFLNESVLNNLSRFSMHQNFLKFFENQIDKKRGRLKYNN